MLGVRFLTRKVSFCCYFDFLSVVFLKCQTSNVYIFVLKSKLIFQK